MNAFIGEVAPTMSPALASAVFRAFDSDLDFAISFEEFICGIAVVLNGTPAEQLQLVFKACDQVRGAGCNCSDYCLSCRWGASVLRMILAASWNRLVLR